MFTTVAGDRVALNDAAVAGVAAVVMHGVGVELFTPAAGLVDAKTILMTRDRGEVAGDDNFVARPVATNKDKYRTLMVVHHQPFEAVGIEIQLVQRFMVTIGMVEVAHQPLDAVVPVIATFQQMPVEACVVVPFAPLSKLIAHEQQLFTREGKQPAVVGAQVGELLPCVARHAVENRFFAVHHFIMRERQDKVFGVVVEHTEGHLVVMMTAMHRVQLHVVEGVMHPTEVPLEPETQPAGGGRTGNAGKIGRLFRHGYRARRLFAQHAVGITQKFNRLQVFPAAVLIRHPLALFAAVVAINHCRPGNC